MANRRGIANARGAIARLPFGVTTSGVLNFIWPQRSLLSHRALHGPGPLAAPEWADLTFIVDPTCGICGTPFEIDDGVVTSCAACIARPPRYRTARAPLVYDDASRRLVLQLKRAGRREGLSLFGRWMSDAGAGLLSEADALVPVPLHPRRLVSRGFNQAGWLASAVSRHADIPVWHSALVRTRHTAHQGHKTARQRRLNMRGAFSVRQSMEARVKGRRLILIDDVLTTGATLDGCTRALLRAGAADVCVVTLARVVAPTNVLI